MERAGGRVYRVGGRGTKWRPMLPRALTCSVDTWPGAGLGLMRRIPVQCKGTRESGQCGQWFSAMRDNCVGGYWYEDANEIP